MASFDATDDLHRFRFQRRAAGARDVQIEIHYSGVCHSDIHTGRGDWGQVRYPLVTGHEIAGVVTAVGSSVTKFRVGDRVGVGTFVDSCRTCEQCANGFEQYCLNTNVQTYASALPAYADARDYPGGYPQGGYSTGIVVDEDYVVAVPDEISLEEAGPLMCAALTVYTPLRYWAITRGSRVGVVGVGGLGHLAIQLARALGAEVVAFTSSADKERDARRFGATQVVVGEDADLMARNARSLDFVLDTVPYAHALDPYVQLLKRGATLCRVGVGLGAAPNEFANMALVLQQNSIAGANTGSVRELRELLAFAVDHDVRPQVQVVPAQRVGALWPQVVDKHARYRYVLDMRTLR
ncbi:NAD(P)-dependent alcohol dehydrogenase [Kineococcus indalonis]|uniref:NAD(P)-dependent alcohol dehydrogenase n=1 Tax=Kineococcus indalonis TaxID=2696566 RepID=UPI0014120720|nr:NAD(P)-dependent alcohol dehydrogenase [Kineococcus indalonis]NAZ85729.1 alcohol dehydrogenase catalytic domain-containing protein [Kineococcus indalonis]